MDEALVRGLIQGLFFFVPLALIGTFGWKLARSQSEGARRLKIVLKLLAAGAFVMVLLSVTAADRAFLLTIAAVLGAAWWVIKGFRK